MALHDSKHCEWDGNTNENYANLNCKIIKALELGYQCSEIHIKLLKKWFGKDSLITDDVKYCPMTSNTAHSVQGIDKILITKISSSKFKIDYSTSGMNIKYMASWSFDTSIIFQIINDNRKVISSIKFNIKKAKIVVQDQINS